jgi:deoxyribonuclease-1
VFSVGVGAHPPYSERAAKEDAWEIYTDHRITFYCGCEYREEKGRRVLDLESCGYRVSHNTWKANQFNWEHVVPVSVLAAKLDCYNVEKHRRKGKSRRNYCKNAGDPAYDERVSDLHNLVPSIGEINSDRSNHSFATFENDSDFHPSTHYGECKFRIKVPQKRGEKGQVEPPERARGAIARIYLYMEKKYGDVLNQREKILFNKWTADYPVTKWECERDRRIFKHQRDHNEYVVSQCNSRD